jgi:hypothetical protein
LVGKDLDALKKAAISRDFKPVPLNARANFTVKNTLREVQSRNVIARFDGSDPGLQDQSVIYTAHSDHPGKDEKLKGDQVFNGALDNGQYHSRYFRETGTDWLVITQYVVAGSLTALPLANSHSLDLHGR